VVRWGAMRFLEVSRRTRRRVFLEELLLMLLRMGLLAVLVVALAGPVDAGRWLDFLADRGTRDVAIVIDGSASMTYRGPGGTAHVTGGRAPRPCRPGRAWAAAGPTADPRCGWSTSTRAGRLTRRTGRSRRCGRVGGSRRSGSRSTSAPGWSDLGRGRRRPAGC